MGWLKLIQYCRILYRTAMTGSKSRASGMRRYLRMNICARYFCRNWWTAVVAYDKRAARELLHRNPVFQPCNLALRNAWFSGGVEWNCGIIGHTPYTCDRMYCEEVRLSDGTPVVRMYQYERVRGLIYRVEAFLPDGAQQLYVRVRIDNARKQPTAVYWWSNIAVDEREDVRVIVPASKAFRFGYGGKLKKIPVPQMDGMDISYTMQLPQAMDFFFDLDADKSGGRCQRRWISAVGGDGQGFVQTSTDLLKGRKLLYGEWARADATGRRFWRRGLSVPGDTGRPCTYAA